MKRISIWWIRRDLRLHDNLALHTACRNFDQLVPLFILEPELMEKAAPKRRAFLLQALEHLNQDLHALDSRLIVRKGPALRALRSLSKEIGNFVIHTHEDFSPFARKRDQTVIGNFDGHLHPGIVLRHPTKILKNDGSPYTVFTPFKNKWLNQPLPTPADCLPTPKHLPPVPENLRSDTLPAADSIQCFPGTTSKAQHRLAAFTRGPIFQYQSRRDRPDLDGTSRLSPYLRFGLISAREAFAQAQIALLQTPDGQTRTEIHTWINELIWREFYTAILYHFPHVMDGPFRSAYQAIPWRNAPKDLKAWQQGQTGFPIVDACMRQLLETGWMHNRGRMIVASFLTKDLLINWQQGEAWFMANLIDGDPAANNGGWQWSAGTGTDAAPYFRIFNPILQGKKHDPEGTFIARWVPELKSLPSPYRHEPWKLSAQDSVKHDFTVGEDYPDRIVDHAFARHRTLAAYRSAREQ